MSRKIFYLVFKNPKSRTCGGAPRGSDSQGLLTAPLLIGTNDWRAQKNMASYIFIWGLAMHYLWLIFSGALVGLAIFAFAGTGYVFLIMPASTWLTDLLGGAMVILSGLLVALTICVARLKWESFSFGKKRKLPLFLHYWGLTFSEKSVEYSILTH